MMEQSRLKQYRVDAKREAADQLADLESVMSKRCVETERRAEHLVSNARAAADEKIRRQQQASEQAWDRKLATLQQKHLSDTESVLHRAQEEIKQCKSDSDKKMQGVLSEAAQYQEELDIATERADAAERQLVVRSNAFQTSFANGIALVCLNSIRL
jgi:3-phosphoglycerate kinase